MVRAKFYVRNIDKNPETGGGAVFLSPVVSGSQENEAFFRWTPGGNIHLQTVNPAALAEFEPGKEYYVDFTKTEKEA